MRLVLEMKRQAVTFVIVSCVGLGTAGGRAAATANGGAPVEPKRRAVDLAYEELPASIVHLSPLFTQQTTPFAAEPAGLSPAVIRGRVSWGETNQQAMPVVWSPAQYKLYLDLNRNEDLTDDMAGVYSCPPKDFSVRFQTFSAVRLELAGRNGPWRVLLDLRCHNYGSHPWMQAAVRSWWHGRTQLGGRQWQVGVVPTFAHARRGALGDYLVLRPWEERGQPFNLENGSLAGFQVISNLFFAGQEYRVQCTFDALAEPARAQLFLTEQSPALGELEIAGKFVHRLVLGDDVRTVVVDTPASPVSLPTGEYPRCQMHLKADTVEAYRLPQEQMRVRVGESTASRGRLAAGGPLSNTVTVHQYRDQLRLNYRLVGADGAPYARLNQDHDQPPQFEVRHDGRVVATGKFEFG